MNNIFLKYIILFHKYSEECALTFVIVGYTTKEKNCGKVTSIWGPKVLTASMHYYLHYYFYCGLFLWDIVGKIAQ